MSRGSSRTSEMEEAVGWIEILDKDLPLRARAEHDSKAASP